MTQRAVDGKTNAVATVEERMALPPALNGIEAGRLAVLRDQAFKDLSDSEVAAAVELATRYDLDPFAKEIWGAKSKTGQLLIMVGRDGLRKIAQRNGLHIDGDVIHEHDEFRQVRTPDGARSVHHEYGTKRGKVIGAWAEVREGGPGGTVLGYFMASMREYRPTNEKILQYSPWGKQESVMILAAAERQAIRQATPLGGLLVEGEKEVIDDRAEGRRPVVMEAFDFSAVTEDKALAENLAFAVEAINELAPGMWPPAKCAMVFQGKSEEAMREQLREIHDEIGRINTEKTMRAMANAENEPVVDAETVDEPEDDPAPREQEQETQSMTGELVGLIRREAELEEFLKTAAGDEGRPAAQAELDQVRARMLEIRSADQGE
jgi:hypothetical protein